MNFDDFNKYNSSSDKYTCDDMRFFVVAYFIDYRTQVAYSHQWSVVTKNKFAYSSFS